MAVPYPTDKFGRSTARQSRTGAGDQRTSAIDAGPAGVPPCCGRRQHNPDTSLDDEWIERTGQAWHRVRAEEIPPPCRAEEFGRRSAHDRAEIMDQVRLVSKAAGVCDIRPAKAALPRRDDLFDPRQSRILFRAGPECCAEAARQVALADIQERGEFSHAQARIAAQPRGSAGKNRLLAILTEILKKKVFDACDPFAAAAALHHPFLQQGDIVIPENVAQSDLDVDKLMHGRPRQLGGALGLETCGNDTKRTPRTDSKGPALGLGQHMAVVLVIIAVGAELPSAMRQCAVLNDEIRHCARRYLDRKARRRIAVRNVPIPDRLDEVGDGGGGPDAPRKAIWNDAFTAAIVLLQLQFPKTDRCRYHEKSSMLRQEPQKA